MDADGHISWNRSFGRVRHRFTVRRNRRLFGTRDYDLETVSAQINESGSLERGGVWSVNGSLSGLRSEIPFQRCSMEAFIRSIISLTIA